MMAEMQGDFVVFLIGMRILKPWRLHRALPLARAMAGMMRELKRNPPLGCLAVTPGWPVSVFYWRSYEQLEAWALSPQNSHWPAMAAFNRKLIENAGDMGFWHETYLVKAGEYEAVYTSMPPSGLGAAGRLVPVTPQRASARKRLRRADPSTEA